MLFSLRGQLVAGMEKNVWSGIVLVLMRPVGESLMGNDITAIVVGLQGNQVHVGVTAPRLVPVHREDVYYRIKTRSRRRKGWEVKTSPHDGTDTDRV